MTRFFKTLGALGALLASTASADTIYVDAALTTGANDGTTWADAYQGSGGLDLALESREFFDEIWLTRGRYRPSVDVSGTRFTFLIEGRAVILGGFVGGEFSAGERLAPELARTILDGDLAGDDLSVGGSQDDNARHVISLDGASGRIDRVTIERGFAWGSGSYGGAVDDDGASASFTVFKDCTFRSNEAQVGGGAVACRSFGSACEFVGCLFEDNRVGSFGGGLFLDKTGEVAVERCEFRGNSAGSGGGMCLAQGSIATVTGSVFVDNESRAPAGGGAFFLISQGELQLASSTVFGNRALAAPVGGILTASGVGLGITNSILWANVGAGGAMGAGNQLNRQSGVSHSHVQGWTFGGTGNSSADPRITDALGGDYEPLPGSPVIDAAGPVMLLDRRVDDFLGKRRFVDDDQVLDTGAGPAPVMDIGAVERSLGAIGTITCVGGPNSTGQRSEIDAFGSTLALDNMLTLTASRIPANQFGIFIVGRDAARALTPQGLYICLTGSISRIAGPGQILNSGPGGEFSLALDLNFIPHFSGGFSSVLPGQSWSFQAWHRDGMSTGGFQFSDTTTVQFR